MISECNCPDGPLNAPQDYGFNVTVDESEMRVIISANVFINGGYSRKKWCKTNITHSYFVVVVCLFFLLYVWVACFAFDCLLFFFSRRNSRIMQDWRDRTS